MCVPEQRVVERRDVCEPFSLGQAESFSVGIIPNLRRKPGFILGAQDNGRSVDPQLTLPEILTVAPCSWSLWTTSSGEEEGMTMVAATPIFLAT